MLAAIILACSASWWDPNAIVANTPVYSPNGRFCAIVRRYDGVPDFASRIAGEPPESDENAPPQTNVTTALYEGRSLIAEIPIDIHASDYVLVSDSGKYVAGFANVPGTCGGADVSEVVIVIYRSDGTPVRSIKLSDLGADDYDAGILRYFDSLQFQLRPESDTREVIVFSVSGQERRIDLATGELLDPKHEFFRHPHVFVTAAPGQDSADFLSRALLGPLPEYPVVARKARITGTVRVSFVVSETGDVISVATDKPLPFGIDQAVIEAAKRWIFIPPKRNGRPVPFTGELLFHFENVWQDVWQEAMRHAPPG
jgi:protein TonB